MVGKISSPIILFLSFLLITSPSFGKEPDKSLNISFTMVQRTWLSKGDSDWNIADTDGSPNVLSELEYKHIDSTVIELYGEVGINSKHFLILEYGYGNIRNGKWIDSDYNRDNRQGLYSRSSGTAEDDNLWYLNIDYALRIFTRPDREKGSEPLGVHYKQDLFIDVLLGYQHWKEDIIMTNGFQEVPATGAFFGLKSTYIFEWDSIRIGARGGMPLSDRLSLKASLFVIPWTHYRGEGIWNLRTDFRQDPSFKHKANGGFGGGGDATLSYNPWRSLFIEMGYRYWRIESGDGTDTTYFSSGRVVTSPFNKATSQRHGVIFGINYVF